MEETTNVTQEQEKQETKTEEVKKPAEKKEPDVNVQDLMNELAKLKREKDKAASEAADFKKKYRESLSEVEKASMEKAEKEAARDEELTQLRREVTINRMEKNYMQLGFTADEASRMAVAETDGDQETKIKILSEVDGRKKKELEQEFFASRPDVNIGGASGISYTKEEFMAMTPTQLTKLKRENEAEYERLMAL